MPFSVRYRICYNLAANLQGLVQLEVRPVSQTTPSQSSEASPLHPTVIRTGRGLTVAGTRITLYAILDYVKTGWPSHLIRDWLHLTDQQMQDVMAYIDAHREEVEAEYQLVLRQAAEHEQYWADYNREHFERVENMPPKPEQEKIRAKLKARKAQWKQIP